jgi:hypothetical protein
VFLPAGIYWNPDPGYRRLMVYSLHFDPLPDFAVGYPRRIAAEELGDMLAFVVGGDHR